MKCRVCWLQKNPVKFRFGKRDLSSFFFGPSRVSVWQNRRIEFLFVKRDLSSFFIAKETHPSCLLRKRPIEFLFGKRDLSSFFLAKETSRVSFLAKENCQVSFLAKETYQVSFCKRILSNLFGGMVHTKSNYDLCFVSWFLFSERGLFLEKTTCRVFGKRLFFTKLDSHNTPTNDCRTNTHVTHIHTYKTNANLANVWVFFVRGTLEEFSAVSWRCWLPKRPLHTLRKERGAPRMCLCIYVQGSLRLEYVYSARWDDVVGCREGHRILWGRREVREQYFYKHSRLRLEYLE